LCHPAASLRDCGSDRAAGEATAVRRTVEPGPRCSWTDFMAESPATGNGRGPAAVGVLAERQFSCATVPVEMSQHESRRTDLESNQRSGWLTKGFSWAKRLCAAMGTVLLLYAAYFIYSWVEYQNLPADKRDIRLHAIISSRFDSPATRPRSPKRSSRKSPAACSS